MDLTELRIFKAVAEQGGILRAASTLNRVQSNVTTRVKRLEARLGTRLFNREGRRLVLSAEGKVLLEYAERLLQLSSEAQAAVKGRAPHGVLKIGALESTAATRLPQVLARFHKAHPTVRLELITGTTAALAARVMRGESPAMIPFGTVSSSQVIVNHAAARAAGLTTPQSMVAKATKVIDE